MTQPLTIDHLVSFMYLDDTLRQKIISDVIQDNPWTQVVLWSPATWRKQLAHLDETDFACGDKEEIDFWAKWLYAMRHLHKGHLNMMALHLTNESYEAFSAICEKFDNTDANTFTDVRGWVHLARHSPPVGPLIPYIALLAPYLNDTLETPPTTQESPTHATIVDSIGGGGVVDSIGGGEHDDDPTTHDDACVKSRVTITTADAFTARPEAPTPVPVVASIGGGGGDDDKPPAVVTSHMNLATDYTSAARSVMQQDIPIATLEATTPVTGIASIGGGGDDDDPASTDANVLVRKLSRQPPLRQTRLTMLSRKSTAAREALLVCDTNDVTVTKRLPSIQKAAKPRFALKKACKLSPAFIKAIDDNLSTTHTTSSTSSLADVSTNTTPATHTTTVGTHVGGSRDNFTPPAVSTSVIMTAAPTATPAAPTDFTDIGFDTVTMKAAPTVTPEAPTDVVVGSDTRTDGRQPPTSVVAPIGGGGNDDDPTCSVIASFITKHAPAIPHTVVAPIGGGGDDDDPTDSTIAPIGGGGNDDDPIRDPTDLCKSLSFSFLYQRTMEHTVCVHPTSHFHTEQPFGLLTAYA